MISNIEIRPSVFRDTIGLFNDLRQEDLTELINQGLDPKKTIINCYRKSLIKKTLLIDSQVSAMWGIKGTILGNTGNPFLLTANSVTQLSPIVLAKIYKQEVKEMSRLFPILENYVDCSYKGAVRLLKLTGFKFGEPFTLENSNAQFQRFYMVTE